MPRTLIVVQKNDHSLGYYDPESGAPRGRVGLDPYPHEFALSADGRLAYCCHFGVALAEDEGPGGNTISVVDVAAKRHHRSLDCGDFRRPHGIALDRQGRLYALSEGASRLLIAPEPETGGFSRDQPTGGLGSHWVTVTGDGRLAFVSNMASDSLTVLFPQEPARPPVSIPVGRRPEGSVLDAEEARLYLVNRESAEISVIEVATLRALAPIATPPGPVRICRDAQGRLLVPLYHDRALAIIDPTDPTAQTKVALPEKPVAISYDPDLGWAFVSTLGDKVWVVDIAAERRLHAVETAAGPDPSATVMLES